MSIHNNKIKFISFLILAFSYISLCADNYWLGGYGQWTDSNIWSKGSPPSLYGKSSIIDKPGSVVKLEGGISSTINSKYPLVISANTIDPVNKFPALDVSEATLSLPNSLVRVGYIDSSDETLFFAAGSMSLISGKLIIGSHTDRSLDLDIGVSRFTKNYRPHVNGILKASGTKSKPFLIQNESRHIDVGAGINAQGTLDLSGYGKVSSAGALYLGNSNGTGVLNINGSNLDLNFNYKNKSKIGLHLSRYPSGTVEINLSFDENGISPIVVTGNVFIAGSSSINIELNDFKPEPGQEIVLIDGSGVFALLNEKNFASTVFANLIDGEIVKYGRYKFKVRYDKNKATLKLIAI